MQLLAEIVRGKTVALVGNSSALPGQGRGDQIDDHEVVIRMNLGLPKLISGIGSKTTIWAAAKHWKVQPPDGVQAGVFMKLTALGDQHWPKFHAQCPNSVRWPADLEAECRAFVGADPGTGIRLLWWLKTKADPDKVTHFGMDCWLTTSHWSGSFNTPNHRPDLELAAMQKLTSSARSRK